MMKNINPARSIFLRQHIYVYACWASAEEVLSEKVDDSKRANMVHYTPILFRSRQKRTEYIAWMKQKRVNMRKRRDNASKLEKEPLSRYVPAETGKAEIGVCFRFGSPRREAHGTFSRVSCFGTRACSRLFCLKHICVQNKTWTTLVVVAVVIVGTSAAAISWHFTWRLD